MYVTNHKRHKRLSYIRHQTQQTSLLQTVYTQIVTSAVHTATDSKSNGFNFPTTTTAKCPYHVGIKEKSPDYHEEGVAERVKGSISNIYDTVFEHVGMTPMVRKMNLSLIDTVTLNGIWIVHRPVIEWLQALPSCSRLLAKRKNSDFPLSGASLRRPGAEPPPHGQTV